MGHAITWYCHVDSDSPSKDDGPGDSKFQARHPSSTTVVEIEKDTLVGARCFRPAVAAAGLPLVMEMDCQQQSKRTNKPAKQRLSSSTIYDGLLVILTPRAWMRDKRRPIAVSALSRVTTLPRRHHPPSASFPHMSHHTFHNNETTTTRASTTATTTTKTTTMPPSYKNSTTEEVELLATGSQDVEKGSGEQSPAAPYSSKTNIFSSAASVKAMTSCLLYSFCSVSMILVNKSLASR